MARKVNKPLSAVKKLMWTMSKNNTLMVTEGRYQKRGNRGNPVTVNQGTLAEQRKSTTMTVTPGLPIATLGNPESNHDTGDGGSNSEEYDEDGYRVTTVTDVETPVPVTSSRPVKDSDLSHIFPGYREAVTDD